ncbi:uncharacterized protein ANIA_11271 [Aspergillus nidulans FGSC A4]|uniref:Uncharacterized protein n=1 Tax=Emericella nidulans (strain FGSC A4 / ATCC 38163 / CBS 112.46 / NRRL 194 / M139) TaxID=227321 RepID=C8VSN8_EMENI|nr:hypothetical protein [Aspergillus nidulans FGSC A4]CBF89290.1 TPA: hypothetical protein ANIA_11271 [Aspergillus nidulans FGSC A4]
MRVLGIINYLNILATQRVAPPGFGAAKNIQNPMDN